MIEASRIFGFFSLILLAVAIGAWLKLWRRPKLARLDGAGPPNPPESEFASRLLVVAAGLSAVAAILAIAGWFAT
jgi:hypothetical protein